MKRHFINLLFIFLFFLSVKGLGQQRTWFDGKITLINQTVLPGQISYNWDGQVVQLRLPDGRIKAFSPAQVKSFVIKDGFSPDRLFVSVVLPNRPENQRIKQYQTFLEEYLTGPLIVLRRQNTRHSLLGTLIRKPASVLTRRDKLPDEDTFEYFVYDGQTFRELYYYNRDVEPLLSDYQNELNRFVWQHGLNTRLTRVQLMLVNRFNYLKVAELQSSNATTASAQ